MKMKPSLLFSAILALPVPAFSQEEPSPPVPPGTVEKTVTETVTPDGRHVKEETVVEKHAPPAEPVVAHRDYDPRRQLRIAPRALPARPATPADAANRTETTETTTTRVGARVYNTETNTVVVEGRELPYVTVPVLFVKETAELLDSESRAALDQTADAIKDVLKSAPDAAFDIEGHTSTDGADDFNMNLSKQRAQRIYDELTRRYEIPAQALSAHGYGEMYPKYPNGTEAQMTLDRRVLVVRVR